MHAPRRPSRRPAEDFVPGLRTVPSMRGDGVTNDLNRVWLIGSVVAIRHSTTTEGGHVQHLRILADGIHRIVLWRELADLLLKPGHHIRIVGFFQQRPWTDPAGHRVVTPEIVALECTIVEAQSQRHLGRLTGLIRWAPHTTEKTAWFRVEAVDRWHSTIRDMTATRREIVSIRCFAGPALEVTRTIQAGQRVFVEGLFRLHRWTDDEGRRRSVMRLVASKIEPRADPVEREALARSAPEPYSRHP